MYRVLCTWHAHDGNDAAKKKRDKSYSVLLRDDGEKVFRKTESNHRLLRYEAHILGMLSSVDSVPAFDHLEEGCIFTKHVEGVLLNIALPDMGAVDRLKTIFLLGMALAKIHRSGVVHGDLRSWNIISADKGKAYIIDFEYAYCVKDDISAIPQDVIAHHGGHLKTQLYEWLEAFALMKDICRDQSILALPRIFITILEYIARRVYWRVATKAAKHRRQ